MPIENRGDCGGPPQTGRSRWRQQHDQPDVGRRLVEISAECFDRILREVSERRLTVWRVVCAELLSTQGRSQSHGDRQDKPPAFGHGHLRQPRRDQRGHYLRK